MFKKNDYVVYKRNVCKIKEIKQNHYKGKDYYVLTPIDDETLTIDIPIENKLIRPIMNKEEAIKLIEKIKDINIIQTNDKIIEMEYKNLMKSNKMEDLIKIIKTSYLRNDNRKKNGKKITEKDDTYFKAAESILYNELSLSLGMTFDKTKEYVINKEKELAGDNNE